VSYTFADGRTLKNLLGAATPDEVERAAATHSLLRRTEIFLGGSPEPTFDVDYLRALHNHLFQDVFEWAGHFRHEKFQLSDGTIAQEPAFHKEGGANIFAIGNQIPLELNAPHVAAEGERLSAWSGSS